MMNSPLARIYLLKCHRILLTVIVPTVETKCQHNKSSPRIKRGRGPSDEHVAPPRRGAEELRSCGASRR